MIHERQAIALDLAPGSRTFRLREMHWAGTHRQALVRKHIVGGEEDTLIGYAKDFAALLQASDPFIQPDELIVGSHLTIPDPVDAIDLGYYDRHYPPGHATILRLGLPGIRDHALARLQDETDPERREFLQAVAIAYDAACNYALKHAALAGELAAAEQDENRRRDLEQIAAVCAELAATAPSSFHAALQLFQFTRVFGGHGCVGRFDQWMLPFYRQDIDSERITQKQAQELLECLFVKMNEYGDVYAYGEPVLVHNDDLRNIALAGQTPEGTDACNELTYMCLEASAKLMLPEPKLNVRFFDRSPRELLRECGRVLAKGANVLAIFNDEVVVPSLTRLGIPLQDARDYCNDGCSELIIGGKGTISFRVHDSLTALTDTVLSPPRPSAKGVEARPYTSFDEVMAEFKSRLAPYLPQGPGVDQAVTFPYFAASIEDCLDEASPTGVRYSIWGSILAEVGNTADGLAAIKQLVFDQGVLSWDQLVEALESDYAGHEPLRQMLLNRPPKYGNDEDEVDRIAAEIAEYFCDEVHARGHNPSGRGAKWAPGLMCFGIHGKMNLPASPDGRRQGDPCANSFSPSPGMDRSGPTAVLKSLSKVDLSKASHGSVLDIALHPALVHTAEGFEKFVLLLDAFLKMPCSATLQVNIIDRDTLLRARANPRDPEFRTLIVRVWGFSAVFVDLPPPLQDHVLARTEHEL